MGDKVLLKRNLAPAIGEPRKKPTELVHGIRER